MVLGLGDQAVWAVPILLSKTEKYDVERGGEFFNYLSFKWLIVERGEGTKVVPAMTKGEAKLVEMADVIGFEEQAGNNTTYTIHPEEILADNFKLMVLGKNAKSPEVLQKIRVALGIKTLRKNSRAVNASNGSWVP